MPGLYLLQLFETKENCSIQANLFKGAHIGGTVTIDDDNSGENFCGNAGDTTGNSHYTDMSDSKSDSNSRSSSSAGANAGASAMKAAKHGNLMVLLIWEFNLILS